MTDLRKQAEELVKEIREAYEYGYGYPLEERILAFAKEAQEAERERCAKVCEDRAEHYFSKWIGGAGSAAEGCAYAIRNQG